LANEKEFGILIDISRNMEKTLSAIEKSLAPVNTAKKSSAIGGAVNSLASMAASVEIIVKALTTKNFKTSRAETVLWFVKGLSDVTKNINIQNSKQFTELSNSLLKFVESMSGLSLTGMAKIALAQKMLFGGKNSVVKKLIHNVVEAVKSFTGADLKKVKDAGEGIGLLANGLKTLGQALAVLGLVAVAAPLILAGAGVARLVVGMFIKIGEMGKEIQEGGKGIKELGRGLVNLAAGLAVMGLVVAVLPIKYIAETILIVAAIVEVFNLIGKIEDKITKGTEAVTGMGLALVALGVGVAFLSLAIILSQAVNKNVIWESVLLVASYALVFAIAGAAAKYIAEGALAVILGISVSLFFFSGGIMILGKALSTVGGWAAAILGPLLIGYYVAVLSGIGALDEEIFQGALGIAAIGASLLVFSLGIVAFGAAIDKLMSSFGGKYGEAALISGAVILGFGLAFAGVGLVAPFAMVGAVAMITVSIALITIAVGMTIFGLAVKAAQAMNVIEKQTDGSYKFIGIDVIVGIMDGFASIGIISSIKAVAASVAAVAVSVALTTVSIGLLFASAAVAKIPKGFTDILFKEGSGVINVLFESFAAIGEKYGGSSFSIYSRDYDPVSQGARAVYAIGDALSSIAGGIAAFANFEKFPIKIVENGKLVWSTANLLDMVPKIKETLIGKTGADIHDGFLYSIADVFGQIGNAYPGDGFFSDNSVKTGVDAVKGIGDALSSITGGIASFANFNSFPTKQIVNGKLADVGVNLWKIPAQIQAFLIGDGKVGGNGFLFSLANVFATIADAYPSGFLGLGAGKVKKGADAVKEVGDALKSTIGSLIDFAELETKGVPSKFDPKTGNPIEYTKVNLGALTKTIMSIVTTLPDAFANIQNMDDAKDNAEKYKSLSDALMNLGSSLKAITSGFYPKGPNSPGILSMLTTEIKNFSSAFGRKGEFDHMITMLDKMYVSLKKLSDIGSPFSKFETSFSKMSSDLGVFAKNFKSMDAAAIQAFRIWTEALTNFVQVDPKNFQNIADQLEKVINAPLNVQDQIDRKNAASQGNQGDSGIPFLQNPDAASKITQGVVDRHSEKEKASTAAKASDIQEMKDTIALMSQQIDRLVNTLNSGDGIKVHIVN